MITRQEIVEAAMSHLTDEELRVIIDCELSDTEFETGDFRLMLAADLICDAALEVVAQLAEEPTITKMVALDDKVLVDLSELEVVSGLIRSFRDEKVSMEELQTLLLRSSFTDVISNMLGAGISMEDIAEGEVAMTPMRSAQFLKGQSKSKGMFKRLFGGV